MSVKIDAHAIGEIPHKNNRRSIKKMDGRDSDRGAPDTKRPRLVGEDSGRLLNVIFASDHRYHRDSMISRINWVALHYSELQNLIVVYISRIVRFIAEISLDLDQLDCISKRYIGLTVNYGEYRLQVDC